MAISTPTQRSNFQTSRSVSLPLESNPIMARVTRELNNLRNREESSTSTAETISIGLSGIADLYKCIGDALSLPLTQQSLSLFHHRSCVEESVEITEKLAEVCSASKNLASELKDASRNLRSSLFQGTDSSVSSYVSSRKRTIKNAKQLLSTLKSKENEKYFYSSKGLDDEEDRRLSTVMSMLRCVSIISISILESLLVFLATPASKPTSANKFGLISKLMVNSKPKSIEYNLDQESESCTDELKDVHAALCQFCPREEIGEEKMRLVCKRLEALEVGIEGIVNGLNSLSRQLIANRTSLLQIISMLKPLSLESYVYIAI